MSRRSRCLPYFERVAKGLVCDPAYPDCVTVEESRKEKAARQQDRNRQIIRRAKDVPCADCGQVYPWFVMDFDHKAEDKTDNVGRMVYGPTARLLTEMAKCDVVCSNCHRIRTHGKDRADV